MIRIAVLGDIGSGKSFFAKQLKIPVFNADQVVSDLYNSDKRLFLKLKKIFPKQINSFPINKINLMEIIKNNEKNFQKVIKIVHPLVREKMNIFLKKNKKQKAVVLDIPLFLENKLNLNTDILVFIDSKRSEIMKRLKKRTGFSLKIYNFLKKNQIAVDKKKQIADFIIKNNFNSRTIKIEAKNLLNKIII